ncbi:helix-turn-helix transcriptional regulator [Peribacillus sp. TH14]|uniref:helix-turn-helix transcriptional regulator n=1 Tax=Peribacillus sp. TH14 TaxID=2798481 RepID=UPI0019113BBF|nr:helix-turn-helix transcriptional regulator [Peribacillus sp. TH14]MBK5500917.1 helix-turn-helix transcriptional regulator [Peribacillus sp. TH14]
MSIRNRLKELRHDHRMNQTEFAAFLGLSVYQYNRYEREAREPTLDNAMQISERLGMTVNEIFYREIQ